jgi:hypothetical protein
MSVPAPALRALPRQAHRPALDQQRGAVYQHLRQLAAAPRENARNRRSRNPQLLGGRLLLQPAWSTSRTASYSSTVIRTQARSRAGMPAGLYTVTPGEQLTVRVLKGRGMVGQHSYEHMLIIPSLRRIVN